jgi:hypothetical protein
MGGGRNPFVDRTAWPAFLGELERNAREVFCSI